jgi:hypothetical protein
MHALLRYSFAILTALGFPSQDSKLPVPNDAQQRAAEKTVKEVFKAEYLERDYAKRRALAQKLILQAREMNDDPTGWFVLLREARDVAADAGDIRTSFSAILRLSERFQINAVDMKRDSFSRVLRTVPPTEDSPSLAETALALCDEAIGQDSLETAAATARDAEGLAQKAKNTALAGRARVLSKEIDDLKPEYERFKQASLRENDPESCFLAGQYLCFVSGNWAKGLPLLKRGSDQELKQLAEKELKGPEASPAMVEVGDGWWEIGERLSGFRKSRVQKHAVQWYRQAHEGTSGLTQKRLVVRMSAYAQSESEDLKGGEKTVGLFIGAPGDLADYFLLAGGRWRIENGELLGTCTDDTQWATYRYAFASMSSVKIRGRIVLPSRHNLRLWVGPIHMIINWELADVNIYRNGIKQEVKTRTHALTPGKLQDIQLEQVGKHIHLSFDGRLEAIFTDSKLQGTVSVQGALGSTVGVKEITVVGVVDPSRKVTAETRGLPDK